MSHGNIETVKFRKEERKLRAELLGECPDVFL